MRRSLLRANCAATAVLALAVPLAGASTPAFANDGHMHSEIAISVAHDGASARDGGRVKYTVKVSNEGEKALKDLEITQLVPSTLKADGVSGKGRVENGEVIWKRSLDAGESAQLTMSGTLDLAREDAKPGHDSAPALSTTACVREGDASEMLACDTAMDPVQAGPAARAAATSAGAEQSGNGLGSRRVLAVTGGVVVLGVGGYLFSRRRSGSRAAAGVTHV